MKALVFIFTALSSLASFAQKPGQIFDITDEPMKVYWVAVPAITDVTVKVDRQEIQIPICQNAPREYSVGKVGETYVVLKKDNPIKAIYCEKTEALMDGAEFVIQGSVFNKVVAVQIPEKSKIEVSEQPSK